MTVRQGHLRLSLGAHLGHLGIILSSQIRPRGTICGPRGLIIISINIISIFIKITKKNWVYVLKIV